MMNGKKQILDSSLRNAFESGYSNATSSLSKMLKDKIFFNNFHIGYHKLGLKLTEEHEAYNRNGGDLLITTEIFGDVSGKSYLFLSDKEFDILTSGIPESKDPNVNFGEEFIKEVDNILSASVITRLSNELELKMYGDIPILIGKTSGRIEDIIFDDFGDQTEEMYINSISFSFDSYPMIRPVFVWVMDSSVFESIKTKSII